MDIGKTTAFDITLLQKWVQIALEGISFLIKIGVLCTKNNNMKMLH